MHYILILTLHMGLQGGVAITTIPMVSQQTCEIAAAKWLQSQLPVANAVCINQCVASTGLSCHVE